MNVIAILKKIWENREFVIYTILIIFIILFFNQCNKTKKYKNELETTQKIASQNIAAINDSTIQLKVTREQLYLIDKNLSNALIKIDSIEKIKSNVITVIKPIYLGKEVVVGSNLIYDSIKKSYSLYFSSEDLVRTIKGISGFKINNTDTLIIIPDSTRITEFGLNFALVVSQFIDEETKYTRTKIIPFNIKNDGELGEPIPESLLKINFRNAELLDKPFVINNISSISNNKWYHMGFGISITPLAFGMYPTGNGGYKFGWTPNIGLSYNITFSR